MAKKELIWLLLCLCLSLSAQTIQIGAGSVLHQGLPIEPLARFTYSQQIFLSSEINHSGDITYIGFQYNVNSSLFYEGNKAWKIFMGHTDQNTLENWIPITELTPVFEGILSPDWFGNSMPGNGWVMIPLDESFSYNGSQNLVLAIDENTDATGASSDDFYCRNVGSTRGLNYINNTINPDPASPPANPNPKTHLCNLKLTFGGSEDPEAPQNLSGYYQEGAVHLAWQAPISGGVAAYRINRNSTFLTENPSCEYSDSSIIAGTTYSYNVMARYPSGEISPASNTIIITVPTVQLDQIIFENFESCPSFSSAIPDFITLDLDGSPTWTWESLDFSGEGAPMAWTVFAPLETSPPLTTLPLPSGSKALVAISSTNPPNNDWLISKQVFLGANPSLEFQARSLTSAYGLERLAVLISTTGIAVNDFQNLDSEAYQSVPAEWTEYEYDLSAFSQQNVFIALRCISVDAFALFVDDILLSGEGGHVDIQDNTASPASEIYLYPNPAQGDFNLKSAIPGPLSIYNIRGQRVFTTHFEGEFNTATAGLKLAPGLYFIRIGTGNKAKALKQIILP